MEIKIVVSVFFLHLAITSNCQDSCNIDSDGVTDDDIQTILYLHNFLRGQVARGNVSGQPMASNMYEMIWDPELAKFAQNLVANTCIFDHVNITDPVYLSVGQNLAGEGASYDIFKNWTDGVCTWFNEVKKYPPPNIATPDNSQGYWPMYFTYDTGHYTQLVWANTSRVGCGFSKYINNAEGSYHLFYVCNYGPGGNYPNVGIYNIGDPATNCSFGASQMYPDALCAPPPTDFV